MKIIFLILDTYHHERLGIMYLSSVAKERGHKTRLIIKGRRTFENLLAEVRKDPPDMICYTCITQEHYQLLELNRRLKEHIAFMSVWGGPHATYGASALIQEPGVDAVCVGEGELAFAELLDRLERGRDYFDVKNFWFKKDGGIVRNDVRDLIGNLDEIPFPDRELFFDADAQLRNQHYKIFMSTRGCPYACTYCFNHMYNKLYSGKGQVLRHQSVGRLIREIRSVREKYPMEMVLMFDDTFFLKPISWFEELAERFPNEVGLPITANARANCTDDRVVALLKQAGLHSASIGVETGDEEVSEKILNRHLSNEQIINACRLLQKHSIKVMTLNIVGHPVPDPIEVDLKTLDLNIAIRPTVVAVSILCPNPGTRLADYAIANGYFTPESMEGMPATNINFTALRYPDARAGKQVARLHKLFGLVVQFPFLRPWVKFLIRLPLHFLYLILYLAWYGYSFEFRFLSARNRSWKFYKYLPFFFRYVFNTVAAAPARAPAPAKGRRGGVPL